jgi:type IV pilus assembly protein PilB
VELVDDTEEELSVASLQAAVEEAPVVKLINGILTDAVQRGASDIHFECYENDIRVRYRIDGVLQEIMKPPIKMKAALISRFKILSELNIAERRVPQDGRIKLKLRQAGDRLPREHAADALRREDRAPNPRQGEPDARPREVRHRAQGEQDFMEAIMNPYGMVLVTGPTGSGKTTTLYSALSKINTIDVNIMTAEDPVEYNLHGINQVQVRTDIGMTFAAALRRSCARTRTSSWSARSATSRRRHRHQGGAHRPPGALHAAHQRRARPRSPA